jgi:hypothetical protein
VKKVTGPTPISAVSKQKQLNPILFDNVLILMLNDPGETAHPITEDALHVIKSEFLDCDSDVLTMNYCSRWKNDALGDQVISPNQI